MPATYTHRHTYEQITGRNKSTWKKPEAPQAPKPKKYYILGIEVPRELYREYEYGNYTVNHDFLGEIDGYSLQTVQRYATDEHAANYPLEAESARKVLNRVRSEVIKKLNGKECTMGEQRTAKDFVAALGSIYAESRSAYDDIQGNVEKAKTKMERAREEYNANRSPLNDAKYFAAKGELKLAEEEAKSNHRSLVAEHDKKVAELRERLSAHLDDHYSASPDKLDQATMQLLSSGICSPSELARLAERHSSNPTMLRIIGNHARSLGESRTMSSGDRAICLKVSTVANAAKDGSRELAIFDSAVSAAGYGLGSDYSHATKMHHHVAGWLDDFANQIGSLSVSASGQDTTENNQ